MTERPKILIVDDKQANLVALKMVLQDFDATLVQALLERGANRELAAEDGSTAQALAEMGGHEEVVEILVA